MEEHQLTYNTLQSQASRQLFRYALIQGQVGPLVFLWALGIAVFVLLPSLRPLMADGLRPIWVLMLIWTVVVLVISYGMAHSYLGDRRVCEQLLHSALERQCLKRESWDPSLWTSVNINRGTDILIEAALDIDELEQGPGPDSDLRRAFDDACAILWLQHSLTKNAEELERNLRGGGSVYPTASGLPGTDSDTTVAVGTLEKELAAAQEQTTQARIQADEASEQLLAFLPALQALKGPGAHCHQLAAAELAQETADVLERMRVRAG